MNKKLLKNICKYSESKYLQKNIRFFELLGSNRPSIAKEEYTYFDKCTHNLDILYFALVEVQDVRMPLEIFASILYGKNFANDYYTKRQLKLLGKLYCLLSD